MNPTELEQLEADAERLWALLKAEETKYDQLRDQWGRANDLLEAAQQEALIEARVQERLRQKEAA